MVAAGKGGSGCGVDCESKDDDNCKRPPALLATYKFPLVSRLPAAHRTNSPGRFSSFSFFPFLDSSSHQMKQMREREAGETLLNFN